MIKFRFHIYKCLSKNKFELEGTFDFQINNAIKSNGENKNHFLKNEFFPVLEKSLCIESDNFPILPEFELRGESFSIPMFNFQKEYQNIYYSKSYSIESNSGFIIHEDIGQLYILEFPDEAPIIHAIYIDYVNGFFTPLIKIRLKETKYRLPLIISKNNRQKIPQ